jgi:hypothetical protein
MGKDLGLEAELADFLTVLARLGRSQRRSQFDVLNTEVGESCGTIDVLDIDVRGWEKTGGVEAVVHLDLGLCWAQFTSVGYSHGRKL